MSGGAGGVTARLLLGETRSPLCEPKLHVAVPRKKKIKKKKTENDFFVGCLFGSGPRVVENGRNYTRAGWSENTFRVVVLRRI